MSLMTRLAGRLIGLPPRQNAVRVERGAAVAMRDGAMLLTDVYHPAGVDRPSTILLRSPYGRGSFIGVFGALFAERGHVVVVQSVRGTFGSEGRFNPFFQEHEDGLDTVEWIERQPWYCGKLGLWGASYLAQVHLAIAASLGERVSAIAIARSTSDFAELMWEGGGFRLEDFLTWTSLIETQEKSNALLQAFSRPLFGDRLAKHYSRVPLASIDEHAVGQPVTFWRDWMAHDDPQRSYWDAIRGRASLERITAPISMVAGWSDVFIGPQLRDYAALRAAGRTVRLTVDPWTHSAPRSLSGGLIDALDWFDVHLNGQTRMPEALTRTRLSIGGTSDWRVDTAWPPTSTRRQSWHFAADGLLAEAEVSCGALSFVYDPDRPTPSLAGPTLSATTGRGDMRALAARNDVLSFTSRAFDRTGQIVGEPCVELVTSADGSDHDIFVCLCDLDETGKATNITDGYCRLPSYAPGAQRRVSIPLLPTCWEVKAGHRLQLLVAGGAFPRYARNLGFGESVSMGVQSRKTAITVHVGSDDMSRLVLDMSQ